ncbi:MAG: hypothetical protein CL583_10810 [Alteromonadaceae bacterium]|nr:hypothetical protein [Alteromonadaceae bacterium]
MGNSHVLDGVYLHGAYVKARILAVTPAATNCRHAMPPKVRSLRLTRRWVSLLHSAFRDQNRVASDRWREVALRRRCGLLLSPMRGLLYPENHFSEQFTKHNLQ